ncbi:MAG: alpha/beta hydrolase [Sedimentisphaerales bacterium]|nr:alpha/beta hydrolase [Sedimentisphaerales bacterium]
MDLSDKFDHNGGHWVDCNDARVFVEEIGDHNKLVLIMLHGGFGNIEDFNSITPTLSKHFRLIGIDSRGHGKSTLGNQPLTYKLLTEDLVRVIEAEKLESFHILGFSDGGIIGYRYAARKEAKLDKLITIGSGWEITRESPEWEMYAGTTADNWKEMFPETVASYLRLNPEPDFAKFASALVAMWTDLSPDGHPGELMSLIENDMLVARGDQDPLTSLASMAKLRQKNDHANILNIPFANHVAYDDAPEILLPAIGRFLNCKLN